MQQSVGTLHWPSSHVDTGNHANPILALTRALRDGQVSKEGTSAIVRLLLPLPLCHLQRRQLRSAAAHRLALVAQAEPNLQVGRWENQRWSVDGAQARLGQCMLV